MYKRQSNDILTNTAYGIDQAIASVASDTTISTDTLTAINSATVTLNALADSAVTVDASSDTTSVTVDLSSPSFTPVSYTHLDVYKRQVQSRKGSFDAIRRCRYQRSVYQQIFREIRCV